MLCWGGAAMLVASCDGEPSESSTATTGDTTSTSDGTTSTASTGTTTGVADDGTTLAATDASSGPPLGDVGDGLYQCDLFAQDCPAGHKCMPWDGGVANTWIAWGCKPLAENPAATGEPCHVEGSPYSGIDDCALGAICWDVDPATHEGTCLVLCSGTSEDDAFCEDPQTICEISTSGPVFVCTPVCDPLAQGCPVGEGCYYVAELWECVPDGSGAAGAYGDPCLFPEQCDPGLACVSPSLVPPGLPCEGGNGCCTVVCDFSDPAASEQCPGAAVGQLCLPWYPEGEAPLGFEDVGACMLWP